MRLFMGMRTPEHSVQPSGRAIEGVVIAVSEPLRRALVLRYGIEVGSDAHGEAIAFAFENPERILTLTNPAGYLYRVAQSSARRARRWGRTLANVPIAGANHRDDVPELDRLLADLKPMHRAAVVLTHGYGYTYREVADLIGVTETAVRNYVHRALTALRRELLSEEQHD